MPVKERMFTDNLSTLIWVALGSIAQEREDRTIFLDGRKDKIHALFSVLKYEFRNYFPVFNELHFVTSGGFPYSEGVEDVLFTLTTSRLLTRADGNLLLMTLDFGSAEYVKEEIESISDNEALLSEFNRLTEKLKWLITHPEELGLKAPLNT